MLDAGVLLEDLLPDRFEPNETLVDAAPVGVAPGVHLAQLSIHQQADVDWYSFRVLRSDAVDVTVAFDTADAGLTLQVHNAQGTILAHGTASAEGLVAALAALSPGQYFVRVAGDGASTAAYDLSIVPGAASGTRVFYVNDASTEDDYYTLAPGDDAHDGLTPSTPKATVQNVLAQYDLGTGDLVLIDTGVYGSGTVTVTAADEGAAYVGTPAGSDFRHTGTRFELVDADYNTLYGLTFSGAGGLGVFIRPGAADSSTHNLVQSNLFAGTNTAIRVDGGTHNVIADNVVTGENSTGVYVAAAAGLSIRNNTISSRSYGIRADNHSAAVVEDNRITQATYGVYSRSSELTVRGNEIYENETGIYARDGSSISGNIVRRNTLGMEGNVVFGGVDWLAGQPNDVFENQTGIRVYDGGVVQFNRVHDNVVGIEAGDPAIHNRQPIHIHHNVVDGNTGQGILVGHGDHVSIEHNTVYTASGDAVRVRDGSVAVSLRNNILWTDNGYNLYIATDSQRGFASDYNNLFTASPGTATLVWFQRNFQDLFDWQIEAGYDKHSIGYTSLHPTRDDPRFVDQAGGDYRLVAEISTSIDAGDPRSLFHHEPSTNGLRANLGAYGNTTLAAASPARYLRVDYPDYYTDWPVDEARPILWHSYDASTESKALSGSVVLDLYQEGIGFVQHIGIVSASSGSIDPTVGSFLWAPQHSGLAASPNARYFVKLTFNSGNPSDDLEATSREPFSVPDQTLGIYYVNDGDLAGDEYTTALGDSRNTGTTMGDPKASLLSVLQAYSLGAGNSVRIDTGVYHQVRNVVISNDLVQGDDEGMVITGPTDPSRVARLDRGNRYPGSTNVELSDADHVTLRHLTLTGAEKGLWVHNASTHLTATDLVVADNAADGITIESDSENTVVDRLTSFHNGGYGINIRSGITRLSSSEVFNNGSGIYVSGAGTGKPVVVGSADTAGNPDLSLGLGNRVYNNVRRGIEALGNVLVFGNTVFGQSGSEGVGIAGTQIVQNVVYDNATGITSGSGGVVSENRVYGNTDAGIVLQGDSVAQRNVVYSNATGIRGQMSSYPRYPFTGKIIQNVVYGNQHVGLDLAGSETAAIVNNTVYQPTGEAVRIRGSSRDVVLRNNILWVEAGAAISVAADSQRGFASNYNDLYCTGFGQVGSWQGIALPTLHDWQMSTLLDAESFSADPLFVDADGADDILGYQGNSDGSDDDFHLQSLYGSYHGGSLAPVLDSATRLPVARAATEMIDPVHSPAIDRGDSTDDFYWEPMPNGGFVNLGAYGNTAQASKSALQYVFVSRPDGGEVWPAGQTRWIRWRSHHATVNLLENPGNDLPLVGGEISGWTEVAGTDWTQRASNPEPFRGPAYFSAGTSPLAELRQDVDVAAYLAAIDAGVQLFEFEGYVRTFDLAPLDTSRMVVEYLDESGSVVLDAFDTGEIGSVTQWQHVWDRRTAPVGTRSIRVRLIATLNSGTYNNGGFDALALRPVEYVRIELGHQDGNGDFVLDQLISEDTPDDGGFLWSIPEATPPETHYRIRVTRQDGSGADTSNASFEITAPISRYYVNIVGDTDFSDNEYTTAAGNDAHDGLSPATPKASIQAVLDAYDFELGDVLYVDTGVYNLTVNIVLEAEDSGVTIQGPVLAGHAAVLNRGNTSTGSYVFEFRGADDVSLDHLHMTGGYQGIVAGTDVDSDRLVVSNSRIYEFVQAGVSLASSNDDFQLINNLVHGINGRYYGEDYGIFVSGATGLLTGNDVYDCETGVSVNSLDGKVVVTGNTVYANQRGITAGRGALINDNTVFSHLGYAAVGITVSGNAQVFDNVVYGNATGISSDSGEARVARNRLFDNRVAGIMLYRDAVVSENRIYSNTVGILTQATGGYYPKPFGGEIINNLIYANAEGGIRLQDAVNGTRVVNNTIVQPLGNALRIDASEHVQLRNNIIHVDSGCAISIGADSQVGFDSDYNHFHITGEGRLGCWADHELLTLADWFGPLRQDRHSQEGDPLFLDPDGDDGISGFSRERVEPARIIDNSDLAFSFVGNWSEKTDGGRNGSYHQSSYSSGETSEAVWTFAGLVTGAYYQLSATWPAYNWLNTNAPYTVWDGDRLLQVFLVSQRSAPNDFSEADSDWEVLGIVRATSEILDVKLLYGSSERADAVHLVRIVGDCGGDDNFGVAPLSPTIDAGDPLEPFAAEPAPNAGRVNQGHTGNTSQAVARGPDRVVQVLAPDHHDRFEAGQRTTIRWQSWNVAPSDLYRDAVLADGPVGYWRLEETGFGTTTAVDSSGNALHGTYSGQPGLGAPGALPGTATSAVMFDGKYDYVMVPDDPLFSCQQLTVEAWILPARSGGPVLLKGESDYDNLSFLKNGYALYQTHDGKMHFVTATGWQETSAAGEVTQGEWSYVVGVYDGNEARIYINGELVEAVTISRATPLDSPAPLTIGAGFGGSVWNGSLDEVAVYGRALSSVEIQSHYNQRIPGTVDIDLVELHPDGHVLLATVAAGEPNDGEFPWNVPAVFGDNLAIRVTGNETLSAAGVSEPFRLLPAGTAYYVNDNSTIGDEYTVAVGDDANSGKSPSAPMASLAALLATYDLEPGDVVYIDTGVYPVLRNIVIAEDDSGVTIQGPTGPGHFARLDRGNTSVGSYVFEFAGADDVVLANLQITGAYTGIFSAHDAGSHGLVVADNEIFGHGYRAVDLNSDGARVTGNVVHDVVYESNYFTYESGIGIRIEGTDSEVTGNTVYGCRTGIVAYSGLIQNNTVHGNRETGILARGQTVVKENTVFGHVGNGQAGIHLPDPNDTRAEGNVVYSNYNGIFAVGGIVTENRVFNNANAGIVLSRDDNYVSVEHLSVRENQIYSNSIGILARDGFRGQISHNLVYGNTNYGIVLQGTAKPLDGDMVVNNTVYQPLGDALRVEAKSQYVGVRNNIFWVGTGAAFAVSDDSQHEFQSDYNLFHVTPNGAYGFWQGRSYGSLDDWYYELGLDGHSITGDPRFVDPDGADNVLGFSHEGLAPAVLIDDGDPGFAWSGDWIVTTDGGYGDDCWTSNASGAEAVWTFAGLTPGEFYHVAVTWPADSAVATVPYHVYDGPRLLASWSVNQRLAPDDFASSGSMWKDLGTFQITSDTLSVTLGAKTYLNLPVRADAVRLVRVSGDRGLDDDFGIAATSPGIDAGDPRDEYTLEPYPNGGRINLGHTGNTSRATVSPAEQLVQVLSPNGRERFQEGQQVRISWHTSGIVSAGHYRDAVLADSPIGYWRLGEVQGASVADDLSGNGRHGTYEGDVTLGVVGALKSENDTAVQFAKANARLSIPYHETLEPAQVSLEVWIKPDAGTQWRFDNSPSNSTGYDGFGFNSNGFYVNSVVIPYSTFPAGEWSHLVGTYDQTTVRLYRNGTLVGSRAYTGSIKYSQYPLAFRHVFGWNPGSVACDELAIYAAALSPEQILEHFERRLYGTVDIDLMRAGNLTPVQTIAKDAANTGRFDWTVPAHFGDDLLVRVRPKETNSPETVHDLSDRSFFIVRDTPDFYVNDVSTAGDQYTTAPGNNANDGKTPGTPMADLAALLAAYDLDSGDVVYVDTGTYRIARNLQIFREDSGVTVQGPVGDGAAAVLDRGNTSAGAFVVQVVDADGVTLDHLHATGGQHGLVVQQAAGETTISSCVVYGNLNDGINVSGSAAKILGNVVRDNAPTAGAGIRVTGGRALVANNEVHGNSQGLHAVYSNSTENPPTRIEIRNNVVHDNTSIGIVAGRQVLVKGNRVYGQDTGISLYWYAEARDNVVYDNRNGIECMYYHSQKMPHFGGVVSGNRVYHNTENGIILTDASTAWGNHVYSNSVGIVGKPHWWSAAFQGTIINNLVYDNTNLGVLVQKGRQGAGIVNNTVYQSVGDAVRIEQGSQNVRLRNNVLWVDAGHDIYVAADSQTGFDSDYNLLHRSTEPNAHIGFWGVAHSALASWQAATGSDQHSVSADPLFVDRNGADNILGYSTLGGGYEGGRDDNFLLSAGSPAIDRGSAWDAPPTDLFGRPRRDDPGTPNLGSLDYAAADLGPSPFAAVGTPQNWRSGSNAWVLGFPAGFSFPFYGQQYTSVRVSTEGFLYFQGPMSMTDGANSTEKLRANRIIAPLWTNLRTDQAGNDIFVDTQTSGQVTIRWKATAVAAGSEVNFAVTLFGDGAIRFDYGPGNTNLSPTVGISRGDGVFHVLAPHDGQAMLSDANSVRFTLSEPTFVDLGAFEFRGDSADATPPHVSATQPAAIHAQGAIRGNIGWIEVLFSEEINIFDGDAAGNYELRAAVDGLFDNGDDIVYTVVPHYSFDPATGRSLTVLDLTLGGSMLPNDTYRLAVRGGSESSLRDLAGNRLDGDLDGAAGADYVRTFTVDNALPNARPQVSSLSISPEFVVRPAQVTLAGTGAYDADGLIVRVAFYRDANGDGVWDAEGDVLLGTDEDGSDGWNLTVDTAGWILPEQTLFVRAQDNDGAWSLDVSAAIRVQNATPWITGMAAIPDPIIKPSALTLDALGVDDSDGAVERVEFYRDANGNGIWDEGVDDFLGADVNGGDGWSWTDSTADWDVGQHALFARARDNDGAWSELVETTVAVEEPVIVVRYRLDLTDMQGNALPDDTVHIGQTFQLRGYVQDVRPANEVTGVYAAYLDALMTNAHLATMRYGETQELRMDATRPGDVAAGGSFQLTFAGQQTAPIPYEADRNVDAAAIQAALAALPAVGAGNVQVTAREGADFWGRFFIRFVRAWGEQDVPPMTVHGMGLSGQDFTPLPQVVDDYIPVNPTTPEQQAELFRSSFVFVAPYGNGPHALDEPSEAGGPAGSRQFGEVGTFLSQFSLGLDGGLEYHFFTLELVAAQSGIVQFSGNAAEENKTLVFYLAGGGTEVNPANIAFLDPPPLNIVAAAVIERLTADLDPVTRPHALTLTAEGVSHPEGTVVRVEFYRDANGDGAWDAGADAFLGADAHGADGWSWTGGTLGWPAGPQTLFARAQDEVGMWSHAVAATVTVTNASPEIVSFRVEPATVTYGGNLTFAVQADDQDGAVVQVEFYRDANGNGVLDGPNDDFETATDLGAITGPALWSGLSIHAADDRDCYRFEILPGDEAYRFEVRFVHRQGDLDAELYDADQQYLRDFFSGTDHERVELADLEPGTYYLVISGYDGAINQYDLAVVAAPAAPDPLEPNDDFETAYDLGPLAAPNQWSNLSLDHREDQDFFRFEILPGNDTWRIEARTDDEMAVWEVTLYDAEMDWLRQVWTGEPGIRNVALQGLDPGDYYLRVGSWEGHRIASYDLVLLAADPIPPDRFEPNEDIDTAADLGVLSGPLRESGLSLHHPYDVDFFRFEIAPGGDAYRLEIVFSGVVVDLSGLVLSETSGVTRLAWTWQTNQLRIDLQGLEPGLYYLIVHGGDVGAYDLAVVPAEPVLADRFEPNDDFEVAFDLGAITGPQQWLDLTIHHPDDWDVYRFEMLPGGDAYRFQVDFGYEAANFDVSVYDADQNWIRGAWSWETGSAWVGLQGLDAGVYFLAINSQGPQFDHYDLTLSAAAAIPPDRFEGDVRLGADEDGSDGWTWSGSTDGWPVGEVACFARAQDNDGAWSEVVGVVVTVASWQNPASPHDVDGDGTIEPLDVLLLINEINSGGTRDLPPRTAEDIDLPFWDVSGDGRLDALDVLLVINYINSRLSGSLQAPPAGSGEGEGGSHSADAADFEWFVAPTRAGDTPFFASPDTGPMRKSFLPGVQSPWDDDELLDQLLHEPFVDSHVDDFFAVIG